MTEVLGQRPRASTFAEYIEASRLVPGLEAFDQFVRSYGWRAIAGRTYQGAGVHLVVWPLGGFGFVFIGWEVPKTEDEYVEALRCARRAVAIYRSDTPEGFHHRERFG